MKWYLVKTNSFKCTICVKENIIIKTSPTLQNFCNQDILNLFNWLDNKYLKYKIKEIEEPKILESQNV